jgi:hypothetical protein
MAMTELCKRCLSIWTSPTTGDGSGGHDWPTAHMCVPVIPRRLARDCPTCGATPGTPCAQIPSGREMHDVHQSRLAEVLELVPA